MLTGSSTRVLIVAHVTTWAARMGSQNRRPAEFFGMGCLLPTPKKNGHQQKQTHAKIRAPKWRFSFWLSFEPNPEGTSTYENKKNYFCDTTVMHSPQGGNGITRVGSTLPFPPNSVGLFPSGLAKTSLNCLLMLIMILETHEGFQAYPIHETAEDRLSRSAKAGEGPGTGQIANDSDFQSRRVSLTQPIHNSRIN